ncbi:MAG: hypothetical protein ACI9VM_000186 [Candidatus Azotimanducaceae bacterium]|jgi:hypothetical protein
MEEEKNIEPVVSEADPIVSDDVEMHMPGDSAVMPEAAPEKSSILGPILGLLIVVLVLILGGLYLWGNTLKSDTPAPPVAVERPTPEENNEPESENAEAQVQATQAVSTSDELDAIVADLESTDLESLEAEMNAIEAELDAAI